MTNRIHSYTVVLEDFVREDDAESITNAISMIRGVLSVTPHVADIDSYFAIQRAKSEIGQKLFEVLYPKESK